MKENNLKELIKLNVVIFVLYFFFSWISQSFPIIIFEIPKIIFGLFIIILLSGINFVTILQWPLRQKFSFWEFLSLSLLSSILLYPLILIAEFLLIGHVYPWMPVINALLIFLIIVILYFWKNEKVNIFLKTPKLKVSLFSPVLVSFSIFSAIYLLTLTLDFRALPDLDPYSWMFKYEHGFASSLLDSIQERPLLSSLTYIFSKTLNITVFGFFKYLIPLLPLLIISPAWMVAKNFKSDIKKIIFLAFIFASPSTILYLQTPMTQMPLIILAEFFTLFLIYSYLSKNKIFYYIAGLIILLGYLYHQAAIIIFLAWIIPTIIADRKHIFFDKKTFFLLLLILLTNISILTPIIKFTWSWVQVILITATHNRDFNLLFPAHYVNIDRNPMGWPGLTGVAKYYGFYIGPLLIFVLLSFLYLFFRTKNFRKYFIELLKKNREFWVLLLAFSLFFTIAEIVPRFPGIALLPERAWLFGSIASFVFIFILLEYIKKIPKTFFYLSILLFLTGIMGAYFINHLKSFVITSHQINSANWIRNNLPKNRIIFSSANKNVISYHADSILLRTDPGIYCSEEKFQEMFNSTRSDDFLLNTKKDEQFNSFMKRHQKLIKVFEKSYLKQQSMDDKNKAINIFRGNNNELIEELLSDPVIKRQFTIVAPYSKFDKIDKPLNIEDARKLNNTKIKISKENNNFYIYYSEPDKRDPYSDRPYKAKFSEGQDNSCTFNNFFFDKYPDKFKRIYNDNSKIVIWEML